MTFAEAFIFSVIGMTVVFFALVLLMLIIKIMTAVVDRNNSKDPGPTESISVVPVQATPSAEAAPGTAGSLKLYNVKPQTAALIIAIVADEMHTPLNELRFRSIREIKEKE